MPSALTLVSHRLCPYVQRAAIALAEKGVAFERRWIDLAQKPDWFVRLSPLGKVPLLHVAEANGAAPPTGDAAPGEGAVIFESAVILEFLEETQPGPLHPADPLERARHRAWIEFGSATLNVIARLYNAREAAAFGIEAGVLGGMFDRVEAELTRRPTPGAFFAGPAFGLVDAAYGPIFRYFDTFEDKAGLRLLDGRPNLAAWREALAGRESVRDAVDADYPERLTRFLIERGGVLGERAAASQDHNGVARAGFAYRPFKDRDAVPYR